MKKVLVVVDMQNDFISGALGSSDAIDIVNGVCKLMKDFDGDIICTLDTHRENYLETREGKFLPVEHCIKGTLGHKLNSKIESIVEEKKIKCIEKNTFGSLDLVTYLDKNYDKNNLEIYIVGLCTDICVIANAILLKTKFYENNIYCYEKLCAGVTKKLHDSAIEVMRSMQIEII